MEWPAGLDEYEKLVNRMNTPRVVIDNGVSSTATLVKVDSARMHGISILLDAVQILADLDLSIKKAYISSDGRWFMDVFHVTDRHGRKLTDERAISFIEQSLCSGPGDSFRRHPVAEGLTALELTGSDRPGLLSEVFAVLFDLCCSVMNAKAWTHNGRIASLIFVTDDESGSAVLDGDKIRRIESRLRNVLKGDDYRGSTTAVSSTAVAQADRRLHQLMFADRDYERRWSSEACSPSNRPLVSVQNWIERGYSVVSVQCRDRPKLLFDVVCSLTDMKYVVFHGTIDTHGDRAHQEFYIRHLDGSPISSDAERQRVIQCLQAAVERRASEGLRLELCADDRRGLLAEVTRTFRENGLSVTRAEVSTKDGAAMDEFYVTDAAGHPVEPKVIEAVIEMVGPQYLRVAEQRWPRITHKLPLNGGGNGGTGLFSIGSLVKRNLYNLGLIRSCS